MKSGMLHRSKARLLAIVTILTMVFAIVPGATASLPEVEADPVTITPSTGSLPSMQATGDNLIRLLAGAFDPLSDALPSVDGMDLIDEATLDVSSPDYFLVQVADGEFAAAADAIEAAGAIRAGNLPDDTYMVRATPVQAAQIAASAAARWVGYYQPAWRIPVAVNGKQGLLDLTGERLYRVYIFRAEPDPAAVASAIAAVDGIEVVESTDRVVQVRGTAATVPSLAAISGVEWIGADREAVLHNANARWANDTGVRDVQRATAVLTGAGQTAAVADTGINYTNDLNGRAHIGFRDGCDADGANCLEAQYTMNQPGQTTAAAINDVVAHGTDHRKMVAYFDIGGAGPQPWDTSSHGSHTGGSVSGDQGDNGIADAHDGLAPGAMHVHQNVGTTTGGLRLPGNDYDLWRQAYRPRNPSSVPSSSPTTGNVDDRVNYRPLEDARTHNNSYGLIAPVVDEGSAMDLDQFVWDHEDMVIVVSAGNGGPDVFSVNSPAIAKNDMTSGAHANGRQPMASIDSMASFSSHGPTGDGRLGVDLATPGQIVVSVKGGTEDGYHVAQGTSMSAPILTGLATLVRQYFYDGFGPADGSGYAGGAAEAARSHNPSAALVKATMVNGAERMRGYYTGDDGSVRAQDGQWPSAGQGWGRVTLDNSLYFTGDDLNNWYHDVWRNHADAFPILSVNESREYTIEVTGDGQPLDVTLVWTDAPNLLAAGTPALVNNLDLEIEAPGGAVYVGNNMNSQLTPGVDDAETIAGLAVYDTKNNVERVRVLSPETGTWTVRVWATQVLDGNQGFALAASGEIGHGFVPGPGLFQDQAGAPTISNVVVESSSGDTAIVTFDTNEPTTATATVNGVTYIDSYAVGDLHGLNEGTSEGSTDYLDRPMLGTSHEILMTGLTHGETISIDLNVEDLAGNTAADSVQHTNPPNVFQPDAPDIGQLWAGSTSTNQWRTGTQLYAGYSDGDGFLGAFAFRLPDGSVDVSSITGASVEFTSAHDWMIRYIQDPYLRIDLLGDNVEPLWGTQPYEVIDREAAAARAYPETTHLRGAGQTYSFSFTCSDLQILKDNLADGMAAFRYDTSFIEDVGIFSADFGFNRRSNGPQNRPRLVLYTADDGHPGFQNCDPATPAPTITGVGVKPGETNGAVTVSWETDVASNSMVLFREQGTTEWIQVGTPALTNVHHVQVFGLDDSKDYEFAVRSEACNAATTTDVNGGAGYDFFVPVASEPTLGNPVVEADFSFETGDEGWVPANLNGTVIEWERRNPGHDGSGSSDPLGFSWRVEPYIDQMDVTLTGPSHTFSKEYGAIRYYVDHNTEDAFDFMFVEMSEDGVSWNQIDAVDGLSLGFEQREVTFEYPGVPVQFRFRFKSDLLVSTPFTHVAVDDVEFVAYDVTDPGSTGVELPTSGPAPAPSAGATGLVAPANRSGAPSTADLAAGTQWCDVPGSSTGTVDAENDAYFVDEDSVLDVSAPGVLDNDTGATSANLVSGPAHGDLELNGDGSFTYTPDPDYVGSDSFIYEASDGTSSDNATVSITIESVNDDPVANDDSDTVGFGGMTDTDVLSNDSDVDGDSLSVESFTQPAHGAVTDQGGGVLRYTHNGTSGANTTDTYTYTVSDGSGGTDTATVTISISDAPEGEPVERVRGSGWWDGDSGAAKDKVNFSFDTKQNSHPGKLKLNDKGAGVTFDADATSDPVTADGVDCGGVTLSGPDTFQFSGTGTFDDGTGPVHATLYVCGQDNGNPGNNGDVLAVRCIDGCNYDSADRVIDAGIDGGNIHVDHTTGQPDSDPDTAPDTASTAPSGTAGDTNGTDSGSDRTTERTATTQSTTGAPVVVVDLDPILVGYGISGTTQVFTVMAHTATGLDLAGRTATLTWTNPDGTVESATAVTDTAGIALFTRTVTRGDTEYIATIDGTESNAINITGLL